MTSQSRPFARKASDAISPVADNNDPPPTPSSALANGVLFLRRNLPRAGLMAAPLAAVLFAAGYFLFTQYSAAALIMVEPRAAHVTQNTGVLANIGLDSNAIDSLVQIAKSEGFLGALVDRLELTHDDYFTGKGVTEALLRAATIDKLGRRLNVARRGTTYVLEVSASSPSAEKSAAIANAAARMIIDDQSELRSGASEQTAQNIEGRLAELRGRVNRAEEAAAEMKARLKVTDAGQNSTLLERRVYELNQQLVLAGAKTGEARARFELLRKAGASAGDNLSPTIQSNVLSALRAEHARLSRQSADQATVLGALHPEVASLKAQIADVKRQIGAEISRMIASTRTEFLEAEQREAALSRQLKNTQNESGELGPQLVKLGELEREAKAERSVYEQLLNRQRELKETKNLEPNDIRIVSRATPPANPSPGKTMLAGGSAAIGLLAGLLHALTRELSRATLKTPRQAERLSGAAVLGLAPLIQDGPALDGPAEQDAGRLVPDLTPWLCEICAELAPDGGEKEGQAILVASARRGEGRTTVAANIAAWFAQGGVRVLLIEADRAPKSKARPRFGFIDVLERGEDLRRALVEHPSEGYTLLPFGGRTAGARAPIGALMSGVTLRATLRLLRRWFDVIVIDGPPALESSHARQLAAQADVTAFVVEWDKTSAANVTESLERLNPEAAAIVFNKVDVKRFKLFDPAGSRRLSTRADEISRAA
jgi:uncharacterized protein involved in exopolysaccharide biosynthesis